MIEYSLKIAQATTTALESLTTFNGAFNSLQLGQSCIQINLVLLLQRTSLQFKALFFQLQTLLKLRALNVDSESDYIKYQLLLIP